MSSTGGKVRHNEMLQSGISCNKKLLHIYYRQLILKFTAFFLLSKIISNKQP